MPASAVQEHYDRHLGSIYSWMLGDMGAAIENARAELRDLGIAARPPGLAVDLGAGPGVHALPLAELGFSVVALDTCAGLVEELQQRAESRSIHAVLDDLTSFRKHCARPADIILCMGDTLTHLPTRQDVEQLFREVRAALAPGGLFVATFRDYVSAPLRGTSRFIPVRGDAQRILTCFLEYSDEIVTVHDIVHNRGESGWGMQVSAYPKLRLDPRWTQATLSSLGFTTKLDAAARGMVRLSATT
jgi:SAM-dependent methyltransferase